MGQKPKHRRLKLYSAYVFKGDGKDVMIDTVHTALEDAGLNYNQAAVKSGVSASTIHEWIEGDTKRPQYCTIAAVMRACGKVAQWVDADAAGIGHNSRRVGQRRNAVAAA